MWTDRNHSLIYMGTNLVLARDVNQTQKRNGRRGCVNDLSIEKYLHTIAAFCQ